MINPRTVTILSGMKMLINPHYPVQSIRPNFHRGPIPHSQSNPPAVFSQPYAQNFEQRLDFWCKRGLEYKNTIWNNEKKFVSPKIATHPILEDSDEAKIKSMKPSSKEMVLEVNEIIQTLQDSSNTEIKLTKSLREAMVLKENEIKQIPKDSDEAKISEAMALKESKIEPKSEIEELLKESEKISISVRDSLSKSRINSLVSKTNLVGVAPDSGNQPFDPKYTKIMRNNEQQSLDLYKPPFETHLKAMEGTQAETPHGILTRWQAIKIKGLGDAGRI